MASRRIEGSPSVPSPDIGRSRAHQTPLDVQTPDAQNSPENASNAAEGASGKELRPQDFHLSLPDLAQLASGLEAQLFMAAAEIQQAGKQMNSVFQSVLREMNLASGADIQDLRNRASRLARRARHAAEAAEKLYNQKKR